MTTLSAETERLLGEFAGKTDVTSDQVDNLRSVIAGSPVLAKQVDAAIAAGYLERFELLPAASNAGGTYETGTKSINLPASSLSTPAAPDRFDAAEVAFVLGHEIQHGFNDADVERAYVQFDADVEQIAGRTTSHDYTEAIGTLLAANRRDEASSNIAGWNALVSQVRANDPDATLRDLYEASPRSTDVIQSRPGPPITYAPHPELTLNADLTISPTAANIEGMAKHYYDQGVSTGLGHHGNSDYQNFYGVQAIELVSGYEAANPAPDGVSRMEVNMKKLGLDERLLEQNGLNLGEGSPLRQPYFDTSTSPSTLHYFDHTEGTHVHVPITAQHAAAGAGVQMPLMDGRDRSLHEQIRGKVAELDAANGRSFDASSERLSASLLVLARENGLERVDHVVLSRQTDGAGAAQNIFVVKGPLDDPASLRASSPTAEAAQRPVQDSLDTLAVVNQRQAEQASQEQTRTQVQEQQRSALSH
ncbi:XVIPCD domain-containing protein [Stenotrophomonas sp. SMYL89]|uniref:XVIPCD domain-containing protein n=1 Tax=Stenotrophomonas sp. SMYL89 TaxID=3076046 RepID=UPI002E7A17BA|nr:XVIPCD domain-containing protein [Stenotrophomonas sp. SMYL89]